MKKNTFPLYYLTWNVTANCNLKCKHCYNNSLHENNKNKELSTQKAEKMIEQAIPLGLRSILFTGGEPLLRKDLLKLMKFAKSKKLLVFLASNGTLIDENFIKNYKGIIDKINLSLDGSSPKKHDKIRGLKGSFLKTIKSIEALSNIFKVSIAFTAHDQNLDDLLAVAKIARKYNVQLTIKRFIPIGKGVKSGLTLSRSKYKVLIEEINNLKKKQDVSFGDPFSFSGNRDINFYGGCLAGINFLNIDFNGNVYPCTKLKIRIGNLKNDLLETIWNNSEILKELRSRSLKGKCKECDRIFSCGGCRAAAYAETGDFLDEDPLCFY